MQLRSDQCILPPPRRRQHSTWACFTLEGVEDYMCFSTISPSKEKGAAAIWAHLSLILDHLKQHHPTVPVLHSFNDRISTQYHQKSHFLHLSQKINQLSFMTRTWSFLRPVMAKDALVNSGKDVPNAPKNYFNHWWMYHHLWSCLTLKKMSLTMQWRWCQNHFLSCPLPWQSTKWPLSYLVT